MICDAFPFNNTCMEVWRPAAFHNPSNEIYIPLGFVKSDQFEKNRVRAYKHAVDLSLYFDGEVFLKTQTHESSMW